MSSARTLRNRKPVQFILTVAGSAAVVAALVTGTVVAAPGRAATAAPASRPAAAAPAIGAPAGQPVLAAATAATARARRYARREAYHMMHHFRWRPWRQFRYLNRLWNRESGWNKYASNPYTGAYGIPQAVPGSKMSSAGARWRTSAWVQIRWGMRYIRSRYGTPRIAWRHEGAYGWY